MDTKFALLLLSKCSIKISNDILLSDSESLLTKIPIEIEDHWKQWLGSIRCEEIEKSNFIIMSSFPTTTPQILDNEHRHVHQIVYDMFSALLFLGIPGYSSANILLGSKYDEKFTIREVSHFDKYYTVYEGLPLKSLNSNELYKIYNTFKTIFSEETIKTKNYFRLRHGITSYLKGVGERESYYRIHQFVRSIESLIMPRINETEKQFIHKCMTFVKHNPESEECLREIYKLRSKVEHIHDLTELYSEKSEEEAIEVINLRARMVEEVARNAFRKVLMNSDILKSFENNTTIQSFWDLDGKERDKIWNGKLDITKIK